MTSRSRRKSRKWRSVFLFALENFLIREGFYTKLSRRDRTVWVHQSKGLPALAAIHDNGEISLATTDGGEDETIATIKRATANAVEIADALHHPQKQSVFYPDTRKDRMAVLASFGDYRLLCRRQRGIYTGFSFLIWEAGTPALYRNIYHNYEEAKERFAKDANLVDDWLNYEGIKALGCAVRYYLDNADEYRPYIMESLAKTDGYLHSLSDRGTNGLYAYAYEVFDSKLAEREGGPVVANHAE